MAAGSRTRILIVDDSAVIRSLLRSVIHSDPALEVAGTAGDGASALNSLAMEKPDLILLDVEMPVMDGLVTLRQMRQRGFRMPVIMCSSLTHRGAKVTIEALANGASDYVAKPTGQAGREEAIRALAQELLPKIHALVRPATLGPAKISGSGVFPSVFPAASRPLLPVAQSAGAQSLPTAAPSVLAIAVSTGGPAALDILLPELPESFPLPVLVVQHMPELFTGLFAERLSRRCKLKACEAWEGAPVTKGTIYIARGNWHMETIPAVRSGGPPTIHLNQDPPENHCRPAADVLFRSVARIYGSAVLSVVLTGMGSDGLIGARMIHGQGGWVLAQDQATSTVWGMPGAVTQAGLAHKVLPLAAMAPEIIKIAGAAPAAAAETRALQRMVV